MCELWESFFQSCLWVILCRYFVNKCCSVTLLAFQQIKQRTSVQVFWCVKKSNYLHNPTSSTLFLYLWTIFFTFWITVKTESLLLIIIPFLTFYKHSEYSGLFILHTSLSLWLLFFFFFGGLEVAADMPYCNLVSKLLKHVTFYLFLRNSVIWMWTINRIV